MNQNVSITGSGNSVMVSGGGDVCINVNGHGLRMKTPLPSNRPSGCCAWRSLTVEKNGGWETSFSR